MRPLRRAAPEMLAQGVGDSGPLELAAGLALPRHDMPPIPGARKYRRVGGGRPPADTCTTRETRLRPRTCRKESRRSVRHARKPESREGQAATAEREARLTRTSVLGTVRGTLMNTYFY